MNILLKNVDEEKYHLLKIEAAKRKMTLGRLFNELVEEYTTKEKEYERAWDEVFAMVPLITKEEAKKMHKACEEFRKETEF